MSFWEYNFYNDNFLQATLNELQSPQETIIQSDDFLLRYQSLVLQFNIAQHMLMPDKRLNIKCVAVFERFPLFNRQKDQEIYILSADVVANQKLVNRENSGKHKLGHIFI